MSQKSSRCSSIVIESNEFPKLKQEADMKDLTVGSQGDLSRTDLKHQSSHISREDSVNSKGSLSSIFKKPFDGSWSSGPVVGNFTPRPEKTLMLFDIILTAYKDMFEKYSQLTCVDEGVEVQDYSEICTKLDNRMNMIGNFKGHYLKLMEEKKLESDRMEANIRSFLSNKNMKQPIEFVDSESYLSVCREMFVIESKLERCTGKLQFQIMELDFIGKINSLDQYELIIRLNETNKFKTKIKIEKNCHQMWECRTFTANPMIDDLLCFKFSEIKTLNKSTVLIEKKLPFINNLIRSEPSIFTMWLSPLGTIKLKVIVQWNAVLDDIGLNVFLNGIENKLVDHSTKTEITVRNRNASTSHKYLNNRISSNIESLFRSSRIDNTSRSTSMSNIAEDADEEKISKEISKKLINKTPLTEMHIQKPENVINDTDIERIMTIPSTDNSKKSCDIKINIVEESEKVNEEKCKTISLQQVGIEIEFEAENKSNNANDNALINEDETIVGDVNLTENCELIDDKMKDIDNDIINNKIITDPISDKEDIIKNIIDVQAMSKSDLLNQEYIDDNYDKDISIILEHQVNTNKELEVESNVNRVSNNIEDQPHLSFKNELEENISIRDESLENILSSKDIPPSHIYELENDCQIIESPIVKLNDSSNNAELISEESILSDDEIKIVSDNISLTEVHINANVIQQDNNNNNDDDDDNNDIIIQDSHIFHPSNIPENDAQIMCDHSDFTDSSNVINISTDTKSDLQSTVILFSQGPVNPPSEDDNTQHYN